jgi:hypothetical protein
MSDEIPIKITPTTTYQKLEQLEKSVNDNFHLVSLAIQKLELTLEPLADTFRELKIDHEERIREVEKSTVKVEDYLELKKRVARLEEMKWKLIGAGAGISSIISALLTYFMKG